MLRIGAMGAPARAQEHFQAGEPILSLKVEWYYLDEVNGHSGRGSLETL